MRKLWRISRVKYATAYADNQEKRADIATRKK